MLKEHLAATVIHIGCGLDSRHHRVDMPQVDWVDCDFPEVIDIRKKYYVESEHYTMRAIDATNQSDLCSLPEASCAVVVLDGVCMYLTNQQLKDMLLTLRSKYSRLHILMYVYTEFGARASKYKNPVNEVGVTCLYGVNDIHRIIVNTMRLVKGHCFTPDAPVDELKGFDMRFFKLMFTGKTYRPYELSEEQHTDRCDT